MPKRKRRRKEGKKKEKRDFSGLEESKSTKGSCSANYVMSGALHWGPILHLTLGSPTLLEKVLLLQAEVFNVPS